MQPRPQTLAEVAARADSLARFGRELADWLHTVRTLGSRPALARTIETAPPRLCRMVVRPHPQRAAGLVF